MVKIVVGWNIKHVEIWTPNLDVQFLARNLIHFQQGCPDKQPVHSTI